MQSSDVLRALLDVANLGVRAWIDGGWGVDALIGTQTRAHDDLDVVIPLDDFDRVSGMLRHEGFTVERELWPTAIALRHSDGRAIDLHLIRPTPDGGGDQELQDGALWHYGPPTTGMVEGRPVPCCSISSQIASHLGYEPDDGDRRDMHALASFAKIALPPPYV